MIKIIRRIVYTYKDFKILQQIKNLIDKELYKKIKTRFKEERVDPNYKKYIDKSKNHEIR